MTLPLIRSMSEFSDIILRCLHAADAREIAEIGAEFGGMSQQLAAYAQATGGSLTSIDPAPGDEFVAWAAHCAPVRHIPAISLDAMPTLAGIDAWILDGDRNYYTVLHELRIADGLCRRDDRPLLALIHNVSWPSARRDFYCAPERIPPDWRQPHSFEAGVLLGDPQAHPGRGLRGEGAVALHEGGPRNGVLTAVENFAAEAHSEARPLAWGHVPAVFGLGVLFDSAAPWAAAVAQVVEPWHDNPLLASLELDRLRNHLAAIEWRDRRAAA